MESSSRAQPILRRGRARWTGGSSKTRQEARGRHDAAAVIHRKPATAAEIIAAMRPADQQRVALALRLLVEALDARDVRAAIVELVADPEIAEETLRRHLVPRGVAGLTIDAHARTLRHLAERLALTTFDRATSSARTGRAPDEHNAGTPARK